MPADELFGGGGVIELADELEILPVWPGKFNTWPGNVVVW